MIPDLYAAVGTNVVIIVVAVAVVILALLAAGVGRSRRQQKLAEREAGLGDATKRRSPWRKDD